VGVEDKKLPHTGWEIRYEFGVGGLSQAEIGLLWAERLGQNFIIKYPFET